MLLTVSLPPPGPSLRVFSVCSHQVIKATGSLRSKFQDTPLGCNARVVRTFDVSSCNLLRSMVLTSLSLQTVASRRTYNPQKPAAGKLPSRRCTTPTKIESSMRVNEHDSGSFGSQKARSKDLRPRYGPPEKTNGSCCPVAGQSFGLHQHHTNIMQYLTLGGTLEPPFQNQPHRFRKRMR